MRIFLLFSIFFAEGLSAGELSLAISSKPNNLNPFFSTDANSQNINRLLYLSLIDFDTNMQVRCRACESFETQIDNSKFLIKFRLKKDLVFWDGTPINAQSVKDSVIYFQDEGNIKSIFRFAFKKIKKILIHNNYTLTFIYESFSLSHLSDLVLLKIIKLKDEKKGSDLKNLIGSGLYQLESENDFSVIIKRIRDNKKLVFKVVRDETTLALKLMNNEIDGSLSTISSRKYKFLKNKINSDFNFIEMASTNYSYLAFNTSRPFVSDIRIRMAINHLIPRKKLLERGGGIFSLAESFFSPTFKGYTSGFQLPSFDLEKAKKLISEVEKEEDKKIELRWIVTNNRISHERAEILKYFFEQAGLKITLQSYEWGTFRKQQDLGNFDLFMGSWIGFTGPDILNYVFHTEKIPPKGPNRGRYSNKELDNILDTLMTLSDEKKIQKQTQKALQVIHKDLPYVSLWHPNNTWLIRKCVKGINMYSNGSFLAFEDANWNNCK